MEEAARRPFLFVCEAIDMAEVWSGFSGGIKKKVQKVEDKLDVVREKMITEMTEQKSLERLNAQSIQKVDEKMQTLQDKVDKKVQEMDRKLEDTRGEIGALTQLVESLRNEQRESHENIIELLKQKKSET